MRESLIAGQYLLIEQVGRGGFAVVWRARDQRLRRDVAVKQLFLPPHVTEAQRREHRERTFREARSAARLSHPGVVTVHDVVEHDGLPWIVMEFVHGRTLGQIVRTEGPLPPRRVAEIGLSLLDALRCAHEAGVLHRDVKPSNVIVGERRVVLGDFGIARFEGEQDDDLTQSGVVMGAPSYTAPERARGEPAIAASDLWSLGATIFYAVEGRRAFSGPNPNATFHAILTRDTPPARRAGPLAPVIEGLLRKDLAVRMGADEAAVLLAGVACGRETAPVPPVRVPARRAEGRRRVPGRAREVETCPIPDLARPTAGPRPSSAPRRSPGRRSPSDPRPSQGPRQSPDPHPPSGPRPPSDRHPSPDRRSRRPVRRGTTLDRRAGRPLLALASLTALAFVLIGNALPADEPRHRPAASYRMPSPRLTATLPTGRAAVFSVSFSPDGRTLATGGQDRAVHLWNIAGRRPAGTLAGQRRPVSTTAFSPDGRTLAAGASDGTVILWNGRTHRRTTTLDTGGHAIGALTFGADGRTLATAGDTVRRWTLAGRRTARPLPAPGPSLPAAPGVRAPTAVRLWDVSGHTPAAPRTRPALPAGGMAFSPDGRTLATAGDHGVRLWDLAGHRPAATLPGLGDRVNAVAFGPGGHVLAYAGEGVVVVWNLRTRSSVTRLEPRTRTVEALAFSPDGRTLATAGDDATVRLWALG
jgi:serine/threonine protein kinase